MNLDAVAESAASLVLSESAALTIALELLAAPAWTIAVCPSREIETPGVGGTTLRTAGPPAGALDLRDRALERRIVDCPGGEWITVISP